METTVLLKAFLSALLAEMRPVFIPGLIFPTCKAILFSVPYWCPVNWIIFILVVGDTIRLGSIWNSMIVPSNYDQYSQLSTENWRAISCRLPQFSVCSSLLWTLEFHLFLSQLGETIWICLHAPSLCHVLQTRSRVGTIVELTLLAAPSQEFILSCLMFDVQKTAV